MRHFSNFFGGKLKRLCFDYKSVFQNIDYGRRFSTARHGKFVEMNFFHDGFFSTLLLACCFRGMQEKTFCSNDNKQINLEIAAKFAE